jgi:hypothetical protein
VADPAKLGSRVAITLTLKGGMAATPDAVMSLSGPVIVYLPAVATRRIVWLSTGFQHGHPAVTAIIRATAGRKWRLVDTDVAFRPAHRARGQKSVIRIATNDEKTRALLAHLQTSAHDNVHNTARSERVTCAQITHTHTQTRHWNSESRRATLVDTHSDVRFFHHAQCTPGVARQQARLHLGCVLALREEGEHNRCRARPVKLSARSHRASAGKLCLGGLPGIVQERIMWGCLVLQVRKNRSPM